MIKKLLPSLDDKKAISRRKQIPIKDIDKEEDYSQVVVKKPWGYEYLIFRNQFVSVWVMFISYGQQTSMHCHQAKKTSIISLLGAAEVSLIGKKHKLSIGRGFLLDPGVFHSTRALSKKGIFVLETETPVCKKDLFRLSDSYGRENQGYESKDFMIVRTKKYYSFMDEKGRYLNKKKLLGKCYVEIKEIRKASQLHHELRDKTASTTLTILKGRIYNHHKEVFLSPGDSVGLREVKKVKDLRLPEEIEVLFISRHD